MKEYFQIDLPDVVGMATPLFALLIFIEMFLARRKNAENPINYEAKDTTASLMMGFGSQIVKLPLNVLILGAYIFAYEHRIFELGTGPLVFVLCFFLEDMTYYWFHRFGHEIRYFWASHIIHHSSQYYNLSTALRQTWTGNLAGGFIFWLPMAWLGIHPAIIFLFSGISLVYQFWIHTEAIDKMGWFEWFFNTPSHHRVHHATNPKYLDKNYAGVLIIWDRMFGTFIDEDKTEKPDYGIVSNLGTFNPVRIAFHEWQGILKDLLQAKSPKAMLGYLFGPPGWSEDGSRKTTAKIKEEWQAVKQAAE